MPFRSFDDLVAEAKRTVTEIDCEELAELPIRRTTRRTWP